MSAYLMMLCFVLWHVVLSACNGLLSILKTRLAVADA